MRTAVLLVAGASFIFSGQNRAPAAASSPCTTATQTCTEWVTLAGGPARSLVYRSLPLTVRNDHVRRALIMVHGTNRNADHYFSTAVGAAFLADALHDTVVISPRIASHDRNCADVLAPNEVSWSCVGDSWRSGGAAASDPKLTSFDFVDQILRNLADKKAFPNLRAIVVAGHSAGGQFVARYQMANRVHDTLGVAVKYVIANPSSYAWPDASRVRPVGDAAAENAKGAWETEKVHTDFTFGPFDASGCAAYNKWPFGLENRTGGYTANLSDEQLKKQLVARPATYLFGQVDTLPLGGFDSSCSAMAQGATRRARGEAYVKYVNERLGAQHAVQIVSECGHNDRCVYTTDKVLPVIFPAIGECCAGCEVTMRSVLFALLAVTIAPGPLHAQKPRERDLKLPIGGTPGPLDSITDVAGVEVGQTTLVAGAGKLVVGQGPVRTGVTVVHPRGKANPDPVFAAWFTLNGNGEMTGTTWVQESGLLEGPVAITNTHSVGVVRDAIIRWEVSQKNALQPWWLPVVAETYDGGLNDINGFHVKPEHVAAALNSASSALPQEGAVGGGTGMVCHGFKGGIGTASRKLPAEQGGYTVGVLVQCNYGARRDLRIAGVPIGEEIPDLAACIANDDPMPPDSPRRRCSDQRSGADAEADQGSIIVVVATDAPLLPHQLKRMATRVSLGIGRQGGFGGNSSGDIFIAFSTANARAWFNDAPVTEVKMLPNDRISPLFQATAQATEAAITNALLAAETMTGANDLRVFAMPVDRMLAAMKKYGRLP